LPLIFDGEVLSTVGLAWQHRDGDTVVCYVTINANQTDKGIADASFFGFGSSQANGSGAVYVAGKLGAYSLE